MDAQQWYLSLPPITRTLATAAVLVTFVANQGWFNITPATVALQWHSVRNAYEVWRLLTNLLFLGRLDISFAICVLWLMHFGGPLEKMVFRRKPEDYLFMLLLLAAGGTALGHLLLGPTPFNGHQLLWALMYVHSRSFPGQQVSIYGLFTVDSAYLPWAMLGFGILMKHDIWQHLVGIAVGHCYYFLKDVYPRQPGHRQLLHTPALLRSLLEVFGITAEDDAAAPATAAAAAGARAEPAAQVAPAAPAAPAPAPGAAAAAAAAARERMWEAARQQAAAGADHPQQPQQ